MQIIWRNLPRLALPAAIGLGAAYLLTSFVPRPAPNLRPPEELRAGGQAHAEESPVRTILEKNVLRLETTLFEPLGKPLAPAPAPAPVNEPAPVPAKAARPAPPPPAKAAFAPAEPLVRPQNGISTPLSGGPQVQGPAAPPAQTQTPAPMLPPAPAPAAAPAPKTPPAAPAQSRPAPAPAAPAPSLEGIRLVGVIAGGERPLAMLQVDGQAVSLRPGEQARGWTLISVEPGQVVMKSGEHVRRVKLGGAAK